MNNEKDYLQELYKDIVDAVQRIQEVPYQGNLDNLRLCLDKFFILLMWIECSLEPMYFLRLQEMKL